MTVDVSTVPGAQVVPLVIQTGWRCVSCEHREPATGPTPAGCVCGQPMIRVELRTIGEDG